MATLGTLVRRREKKRAKAAKLKEGTPDRIRVDAKINDLTRRIKRKKKRRPAAPRVISREEWGAAPPRGGFVRQSTLIAGVQHHTAMPTLSAGATIAEEKERMRALQRIHQGQGWADLGYALVCFPSGRIYEGRPAWAVGAHTLGHNTGYAGWSLDGNYETSQPTKKALEACHQCRVILGVDRRPLYGHYQLGPTACPGRNLKPHLGKEI